VPTDQRNRRKVFWYTLDCMQRKVLSGKFRQYGRRVSKVRVSIRVSVKMRVRFRFIHVGILRVGTSLQSKLYENN